MMVSGCPVSGLHSPSKQHTPSWWHGSIMGHRARGEPPVCQCLHFCHRRRICPGMADIYLQGGHGGSSMKIRFGGFPLAAIAARPAGFRRGHAWPRVRAGVLLVGVGGVLGLGRWGIGGGGRRLGWEHGACIGEDPRGARARGAGGHSHSTGRCDGRHRRTGTGYKVQGTGPSHSTHSPTATAHTAPQPWDLQQLAALPQLAEGVLHEAHLLLQARGSHVGLRRAA